MQARARDQVRDLSTSAEQIARPEQLQAGMAAEPDRAEHEAVDDHEGERAGRAERRLEIERALGDGEDRQTHAHDEVALRFLQASVDAGNEIGQRRGRPLRHVRRRGWIPQCGRSVC
jgi:hypothetical protein